MVYSRLVELSHHNKICQRRYGTMSDNIIQLNEDLIKHDLKDLVRSSVEETLNALLDQELVNLSMPGNMGVPGSVRATIPAITKGIFRLRQGKWSLMFPS